MEKINLGYVCVKVILAVLYLENSDAWQNALHNSWHSWLLDEVLAVSYLFRA